MSKPRADRLNLREVDSRVASVSKQQLADRERLRQLEKENERLRAKLETLAPDNGLPGGFRADNRGAVTDASGKHRGIMHRGRFIADVPEHCAIKPDGKVRRYPFNEVVGRIVDGQFQDNKAELAAAQEQAKQAEKARLERLQAEDARIRKEHEGIWTDVFGIKRIGRDGQEYGVGLPTS